ncbi:larval cuticle protein A3A-like [Episyrphus balteatus]|uniref:larval cuticle protein A3A-like n=1 Tax=Episyrphus balteatus TaxID=286459 RepID=UPI0024866CB4|nr:larval cuticle protein A3A-like [Episyrphus balteatus]
MNIAFLWYKSIGIVQLKSVRTHSSINTINPLSTQKHLSKPNMAFKFVAFFACIAVASAGLIPAAAPLAAVAQPLLARAEPYDPLPQYSYGYDVQDALSGDSKNQVETRDGDVVRGQYSLNDADGYRRIVDYSADSINGFNAVVRREPLGVALKAVAAAPAPLAYAAAAPALIKAAPAPLAYAAAPAPLAYAHSPALINAAPAPLAYASSPAVYSSGPAIVKTSFASPLISYAY